MRLRTGMYRPVRERDTVGMGTYVPTGKRERYSSKKNEKMMLNRVYRGYIRYKYGRCGSST